MNSEDKIKRQMAEEIFKDLDEIMFGNTEFITYRFYVDDWLRVKQKYLSNSPHELSNAPKPLNSNNNHADIKSKGCGKNVFTNPKWTNRCGDNYHGKGILLCEKCQSQGSSVSIHGEGCPTYCLTCNPKKKEKK